MHQKGIERSLDDDHLNRTRVVFPASDVGKSLTYGIPQGREWSAVLRRRSQFPVKRLGETDLASNDRPHVIAGKEDRINDLPGDKRVHCICGVPLMLMKTPMVPTSL